MQQQMPMPPAPPAAGITTEQIQKVRAAAHRPTRLLARICRRALIKPAGRLSSFRQETDEYFSSSLGWLLRLPCLLLGLLLIHLALPPMAAWRRRF